MNVARAGTNRSARSSILRLTNRVQQWALAAESPAARQRAAQSLAALAFCGVLASALAAQALPPDARLALHGKKPHFERVDPAFETVLVEPPALLSAELLPSGELLLEPKGASGTARVFCFARRLVRVIEVTVDQPAVVAPELEPCPPIKDAAAYAACRAQGGSGGPLAFDLEGLQAEAKAAQAELARAGLSQITVLLSAYGVKLKGAKDDAEKRRALVAIWPALLGPLRLDD